MSTEINLNDDVIDFGVVTDGETVPGGPMIDIKASLTLAQALAKVYADDADLIIDGGKPEPYRFIGIPNTMYFAIVQDSHAYRAPAIPLPEVDVDGNEVEDDGDEPEYSLDAQIGEDEEEPFDYTLQPIAEPNIEDDEIPNFNMYLLVTFEDNMIGGIKVTDLLDVEYRAILGDLESLRKSSKFVLLDPNDPEIIVIEDIDSNKHISLQSLFVIGSGHFIEIEDAEGDVPACKREYRYQRLCTNGINPIYGTFPPYVAYAEVFDTVGLATYKLAVWQRTMQVDGQELIVLDSKEYANLDAISLALIMALPENIRLTTIIGAPIKVEITANALVFDYDNKPSGTHIVMDKSTMALEDVFDGVHAAIDAEDEISPEEEFVGHEQDVEDWEAMIKEKGNTL